MSDIKLTDYQERIANADTRYVVCRMGRRTGKDTVVREIAREGDVVVYPHAMGAAYRGEEWEHVHVRADISFVDDKFYGYTAKRLFIMEAALMSDFHAVLKQAEKRMIRQIFIISTPNLNEHILSSGFLFDAICARLALSTLRDYTYITQGNRTGASPVDLKVRQNMGGIIAEEELDAKFV